MANQFRSLSVRVHFVLGLITLMVASMAGVCSAQSRPTGPCDIYASATPCVAAYSTTRAMFSSYNGRLYQVQRASDSTTTDIGVLSNGYADSAAQDSFCAGTTCTISRMYDQTSNRNDLIPPSILQPVNAAALPVVINGQRVYGMYFNTGMGYRNNSTTGIAVNGQPEGVYMVTSGKHVNSGCCFDFGNAETNSSDNGPGHMDAITICCNSNGGYSVAVDMENGFYGFLASSTASDFVSAMASNDGQTTFATYQGNAQSGTLTASGPLTLQSAYSPMKQEGAIILGMGGDNGSEGIGSFYEGVMTRGAPTSSVMNDVQSNIVSAHYGIVYELTPRHATVSRLDEYGLVPNANADILTSNNSTTERWTMYDDGGGYFEFEPQSDPGMRLDVSGAGTTAGTNVAVWYKNGLDAQKWKLIDAGGGYSLLEPKNAPGLRLDVSGAGTADHTNVALWNNNGNDAQKWAVTAVVGPAPIVATRTYQITPKNAIGSRLDESGVVPNANADILTTSSSTTEQWKVYDDGGGYFEFEPQSNPGMRLDVSGAGTTAGTNVGVWYKNGADAQKWKLIDAGGGYYLLEPKNAPGLRLDVSGAGTADHTNVALWNDNGNDAQRWHFTPQ